MEGNQESSSQLRLQSAASLKAYMLKNSTKSNLNLYDHLTRLLLKLIDEQPQNPVDVIEDMSHDIKQGLFEDKQSTLQDFPQNTAAELLAERQRLLFSQPEDAEQEDELVQTPLPNVSENGFYLEQAGVGLGREEMQRVFLALKQLVELHALLRCRLWGKVLGTESSYIVAEAECRVWEEEEEQITDEAAEEEEREDKCRESEDDELDPHPQSTYKTPPVVPKEAAGTGANKFFYYVCKEPGLPWVKLPSVSPLQITVARQIRTFFTGRLDSPVHSYPPFPGNEANYLRAQIARISAGTHVSPQGFFQAGEEEGDEEDEAPRNSYEVNSDFEAIPVAEMAESLSTWVHHVLHILPQGRCLLVNLAAEPEEDSNEDGEAEEEPDEPEPEAGPPLLTPVSQDADLFSHPCPAAKILMREVRIGKIDDRIIKILKLNNLSGRVRLLLRLQPVNIKVATFFFPIKRKEIFNTPPWSSKMSSTLISQHAVAVLRSNIWPGAHAYACGKKFENIYVGWGLKYAGEGYSPSVPQLPQKEYPSEPGITEGLDPSLEEEQALREALEEKQATQEELEDADEEDEKYDD